MKQKYASDRITKEDFDNWYHITLKAFAKIWLVVFAIEVFLFIFFKPDSECSRLRYCWLFVIKPSGLMGIALGLAKLYSKMKHKNFRRWQTSISTILLVTTYCAAAIWIHTSVRLMIMLLMLPMIITTLYKNQLMTLLQLVLCVLVYVLHELYFYPNTPYMPPLNDFINITIFCGSIMVELFLIQHVQAYVEITEKKASVDSMTGLYNHKIFYEELDNAARDFKQKGLKVALLVMDIDKFKDINDTYGHAFGDEVICKVAELLRALDYSCNCARYGGEEFAVILYEKDLKEAVQIGEQIRKDFYAYPFITDKGEKHFSISIGVAVYQDAFREGKELFVKADEQLYHAKQNGRNRVCYEMEER